MSFPLSGLYKNMEFVFFNVGHGACTYVRTPNGKHILVDIGSSDDWNVAEYLKKYASSYSNRPLDNNAPAFGSYKWLMRLGKVWADAKSVTSE